WLITADWDVEHVALSRDERLLAWTVNAGGESRLHVRDLGTGADLDPPEIPTGVITKLAISADGTRLALLLSTPTRPNNVAVVDLNENRFDWLTDAAPVGAVDCVQPTLVSF